jgi:Mor family transcriptional regulator
MSDSSLQKKLESAAEIRRHEMLQDVAESSAQFLIREHKMGPEMAGDVGNFVADFLCDHWGGQGIYIPVDSAYKMRERDQQIYARLRLGNAHDLAREFGISYVRAYQIHKRLLAANRARLQPQLFGETTDETS